MLLGALASHPASAAGENAAAPNPTPPASSESEDSIPEESTPEDTTPEDTTPEDSTPGDGTAAGAGDDADGQDVTALTWLAVIGTLVLVAVAAWWMVRRGGVDRQVVRMDDDWPGETDVI